jgi:hypothetical protein
MMDTADTAEKPEGANVPYVPTYWDARPVVVEPNLDKLIGPTRGVHTVPIWINWNGNPSYNLYNIRRTRTMYETVLREAKSLADLDFNLNKDILLTLWPVLVLPGAIRKVWETTHPELKGPVKSPD